MPASPSLDSLYSDHLCSVLEGCSKLMAELALDCLVLGSGAEQSYYEDDQAKPFRTNAMFAYLCPLIGPGHWLRLEPGKRPVLSRTVAEDYWHAERPFPEAFEDGGSMDWPRHFDLRQGPTPAAAFQALGPFPSATGFVGEDTRFAAAAGLPCNTYLVLSGLQWMRSFKSAFEVECLLRANQIAARGHRAARYAFLGDGSEFAVLMAFLGAVEQVEPALPYNPIIGIGDHAAILHYQFKDKKRSMAQPDVGAALLIDAGARFGHYGSDITRTTVGSSKLQGAALFADLVQAVDRCQLAICDMVRPGVGFADLQRAMHEGISRVLLDAGILKPVVAQDPEMLRRLVVAFIPHGIGHLLGLFVHDVAGHIASPMGQPIVGVPRVPHLRSYRTLEPSMVLTIEPGLYFIDLLLERLRLDPALSRAVNWDLIAQLKPFGGIRIEDNVVVTKEGCRNLTRECGLD